MGLIDGQRRELIPERELGDCVDGIINLDLPFTFNVSAVIWVAARVWSEQRGPLIRFSSEVVSARGVTVRLVVRSIRGHVGGPGEGVVECPLVHPGSVFYSRDKTLDSGSPGPVWVLVRFVGEGGRAIGEEQLVGRCVCLQH